MYVVSRFPSYSAKRTRYTETTDCLPLHSRYYIALPIVSLPSYLPSLVLSKLASKPMLDALATRRPLASPTVFTSHYRKNSHFQTSAPVLLEHSLSFTLQLFRSTIPHTQTLTLRVIVLRSHPLPFRARARVALSDPLVSLLPCTRAPIFPVAVACTRTERSTQTVRYILFRFEHRDLESKPTHLGHDPNRFVFTIQTLSGLNCP